MTKRLIIAAGVAALLASPTRAEPTHYPRADALPFSEAVETGSLLFLSGTLADSGDGKTVVPGGIEAESKRVMDLIGQNLAKHDLGYDDLVRCQVLLADMKDWPTFNRIYAGYFKPGHFPARSALGVNGLALGARVEVECVAQLKTKR
jgi:reactive intermediate/imine deaminase